MILQFTFVHTVTVRTFMGATSYGRSFADPLVVACYVQDMIQQVRSTDGEEVTSTAKLNAALSAAPSYPPQAGQFTAGSEVILPSGRTSRVIMAGTHDSGPLALGLDHVQVFLE